MRICSILILLLLSTLHSEEISIDTFADNYTRLSRAVSRLEMKGDARSKTLVEQGRERLSHYEQFLQDADKDTIEKLIKLSLKNELFLRGSEDRKQDIAYAEKLTDQLIDKHLRDVKDIFLPYSLSTEKIKRHIEINRDNINTENILQNIDYIEYFFPFGEVILKTDSNEWEIKSINVTSDFTNLLKSKLLSDFSDPGLIDKIKQNTSMLNLTQMSFTIANISFDKTQHSPEGTIHYNITLHPDKDGPKALEYYNGLASLLVKIYKIASQWKSESQITSMTMPQRKLFYTCSRCKGTGYSKIERVTLVELQEMNAQYASSRSLPAGSGTYEIELPYDVIKQESQYVYIIGYKCATCNKTGGESRLVMDQSNAELKRLRVFSKNEIN